MDIRPTCCVAALIASLLAGCGTQNTPRSAAIVADPATETAASPSASAALPDPGAEAIAKDLFDSLTSDQRGKAIFAFDDARRQEVSFPGGERAGVQFKALDPRQRALADQLISSVTSPAGRKRCDQIAAQAGPEGYGRFYLAFFGKPGGAAPFAWRIAEQNLTLADVEVRDSVLSIGPVLLGSNPSDVFGAEEDRLIAFYQELTPDERAQVVTAGQAPSGEAIVSAGTQVWRLGASAQAMLAEFFEHRLGSFSPKQQERIRAVVEERGGLKAMHVAFYGTADKRASQGGTWAFKLGGPTFLCDFEGSSAQIRTCIMGRTERAADAH